MRWRRTRPFFMFGKNEYHSSTYLLFGSIAFILAVAWQSFIPGDFFVRTLITLLIATILIVSFWSRKFSFFVVFVAFCGIFGFWRFDVENRAIFNFPIVGENIDAFGFVDRLDGLSGGFRRVLIRLTDCQQLSGCVGEGIITYVPSWQNMSYGMNVRVRCLAQDPKEGRGGENWKMYLAVSKIKYQCFSGKVEKVDGYSGSLFLRYMSLIKDRLESNIVKTLPQPHASLGNNLLFGGSGSLSKDVRTDFYRTSMTHVMAVSGYNISLLAYFFICAGVWIGLWRKQALIVAFLGILFFVVMIGFQASAVRAAIMGSLVLMATYFGKRGSVFHALFFAAAVMIAYQPFLLRWDIGFQLSFLATLGILLVVPLFENFNFGQGPFRFIGEIIIVSSCAQLFVAPIIAYHFHGVSLIGVLANVFILWIIPFSMIGVALTSLIGFFAPVYSVPFSWASYAMLQYEIFMVQAFADIPFGYVEIVKPNVILIVIIYFLLFLGVGFAWLQRTSRCPMKGIPR